MPEPTLRDRALERAITRALDQLLTAPTAPEKRAAFERMAQLISRRSPEQVARMEHERGLR